MKKAILFVGLIIFSSCITKNSEKESLNQELTEMEIAKKTFSDINNLLKIDNGKFWNKQLNGPIIIVNPETRGFFANENNTSLKFKKINSLFSDTLQKNINIANTALNWENKRWTMVMLPLPIDKISRNNLVIHELFHRIQPEIGFENLQEGNNSHLDTYEGRLLLKLELEALKGALSSNTENKIRLNLKNALTFRNIRQNDSLKKIAENLLEINEGLAEYTAIMLSGRTEKEMKIHLTNSINQFYTNPTFVRSFAYQTIPVYGYLLSKQKNNWNIEISGNTNLTDYFVEAFAVDITNNSSFEQIAKENDYDYQNIVMIETTREDERLAKVEEFKRIFLKEPILKLNFENMNISFDPRNITPLENLGTVYPTMRVTDNWGILTVENGALLDSNWGYVTVSKPTEINNETVKGFGWTLELRENWIVEKKDGKFILKKK